MMIAIDSILFNKVSWTEFYGADPSPQLQNEAETPSSESSAEATAGQNFESDSKGKAHGLVQAKTLNMKRLGAVNGERFMFGTVVSVAPHPEGGQVIVGWQPHAEIMSHRRTLKDTGREYNYRAPTELAVVLPVEERTFQVPKGTGGMGQSTMVYATDAKGNTLPWAKDAAEMMNQYEDSQAQATEAPDGADATVDATVDADAAVDPELS